MKTKHQGNYIEARIRELGVTKTSVADKLGTSRQNLENILRKDEVSPKQLKTLSKILHQDLWEVFYDRPKKIDTSEEDATEQYHRQYELQGQVVLLEKMLEKDIKTSYEEFTKKIVDNQERLINEVKEELKKLNTLIKDNYNWDKNNLDAGTDSEQ